MFIDGRFSKDTYNKIRKHNLKIFGTKMYPPYCTIKQAKQDCYPENTEFDDYGAKVHFISLLDQTLRRILKLVDASEIQNLGNPQLQFLGKWGMDGATGQQTTRLTWSSEACSDTRQSDKTVFITAFVPLQLRSGNTILWTNAKPNSVLYCRPISFQFIKVTTDVILQNYEYYSKLLNKVQNYCLEFNGTIF